MIFLNYTLNCYLNHFAVESISIFSLDPALIIKSNIYV